MRRSRQDPQMFEVAHRDLGASFSGFGTVDDTNFAVGAIEIAPGAEIKFVVTRQPPAMRKGRGHRMSK